MYEQQQAPLKTVITIKSIVLSEKAPVYNVETMEGERYQFWKTKLDGSNTVAFGQYSDKRFMSGDVLEIYYQEKEGKPYINTHTNKEVTPLNRIITKFLTDGENNPVKPQTPPPAQNTPTGQNQAPRGVIVDTNIVTREEFVKLMGRVKALEAVVFKQTPEIAPVEDEVSLEDCPF